MPVERIETGRERDVDNADWKDAAEEGKETAGADEDEDDVASQRTSGWSVDRGDRTVETRFRDRFEYDWCRLDEGGRAAKEDGPDMLGGQ